MINMPKSTETTPKKAPLSMPRRELHEASIPLRHRSSTLFSFTTIMSRLFVFCLTFGLSLYGLTEMYGVLSANSITQLQWLFLVFFSINFIWIAYAFAQACLGFIVSLLPSLNQHKEAEPDFKTAVLLPIYNEDPTRIYAAIKAMRSDLLEKAPNQYAFFILSDSNQPDAWLHEEAILSPTLTADPACPVYYRKRTDNAERKAGNIADWVQNWGHDYEAMIVLDADSLMSADCLITLSKRLAGSPKVGLIQTLPTIIRANTLYGRLQQFANHCYGPIYARGLAAWHGLSSNFWGHNAIIRTQAFAQSACLPILPGKAPFGGHVLSHDFIEAALMRRAGWGIRFDTDLKASYEEAPPSLMDVITRDRRWCQGNLQHKAFLFSQGMSLPTRLHIFSGIMSYLSAVFWLTLILIGLAIAIQATVVRPEYFSNPSLFPTWPVFDAERALDLFYVSMALVLAPKVFGWFIALLNFRRCLSFGGPILLTLSTIMEVLFSALYAPILMVSQFGVVYNIFRGKDSGWSPQSRDDGSITWKESLRMHKVHTFVGILLALISLSLNLDLFYWLLPISAGLMLSIPLSKLSGSQRFSRTINTLKMLRSPEEKADKAPIIKQFEQSFNQQKGPTLTSLSDLLHHGDLLTLHLAQLNEDDTRPMIFHAATVTAEWKVQHAHDVEHLEGMLSRDEKMALLSNPHLLLTLTQRFA